MSNSAEDTRQRILDAAEAILIRDGVVGASARSIAAEGGFSQATIFYHFGCIDELLIAAAERAAAAQREVVAARLASASGLGDLLRDLLGLAAHPEMVKGVALTTQLMVGAGQDPAVCDRISHALRPVVLEIETAVARVAADAGVGDTVSAAGVASLGTSLLYGGWVLGLAETGPGGLVLDVDAAGETFELLDPVVGLVAARQRRRADAAAGETIVVLA